MTDRLGIANGLAVGIATSRANGTSETSDLAKISKGSDLKGSDLTSPDLKIQFSPFTTSFRNVPRELADGLVKR